MMGKGCSKAVRKGNFRRHVGTGVVLLAASVAPPAHAGADDPGVAPCLLRHRAPPALQEQTVPAGPRGQCGLEWDNGFSSPGMNDRVTYLTVFDDGNGPALYVGGFFTGANGVSANRIAKWDGNSWSALGQGLGPDFGAHCIVGYDPPGPAQGLGLYVGGSFLQAGSTTVSRIARWDGAVWSALGSGAQGTVDGMTVFDDGLGGGPALIAGGAFSSMGGVPNTSRVAKWNGSAWSALSTGMEAQVTVLLPFDEDGAGPNPPVLFAGGYFETAGGLERQFIARWDGATWSDVGGPTALNQHVHSMHVFDEGNGEDLYVGGHFNTAAGQNVRYIAKWDGTSWSPVGNGFNGEVLAITSFDDGSGGGPQLYAGGFFTLTFEGVPVNFVAKWTGTAWVGLNTGMNDAVWSLTTFDDGSGHGPALYAGGWFTTAGGLISRRVAQWNPADPAVRQPPSDFSVAAGGAAVFSVVATGSPPVSYQWRKDGIDLADGDGVSGATGATLRIDPVVAGHAGEYDVAVTSDCGFVVSDPATLTVTGPPCMDLDDDGDVDASDYSIFEGCLSGPSGGVPLGCDAADCDMDGDVDLAEFAVLQVSFTSL